MRRDEVKLGLNKYHPQRSHSSLRGIEKLKYAKIVENSRRSKEGESLIGIVLPKTTLIHSWPAWRVREKVSGNEYWLRSKTVIDCQEPKMVENNHVGLCERQTKAMPPCRRTNYNNFWYIYWLFNLSKLIFDTLVWMICKVNFLIGSPDKKTCAIHNPKQSCAETSTP